MFGPPAEPWARFRLFVLCLLLAAAAAATLSPAARAAGAAPVCDDQQVGPAPSARYHAIGLSCTDAEGDPVAISIVSDPNHGGTLEALTRQPGYASVDYMSADGFVGTEAFTFRGSDGTSVSAPATVTVDVRADVLTCECPRPMTLRPQKVVHVSLGSLYGVLARGDAQPRHHRPGRQPQAGVLGRRGVQRGGERHAHADADGAAVLGPGRRPGDGVDRRHAGAAARLSRRPRREGRAHVHAGP